MKLNPALVITSYLLSSFVSKGVSAELADISSVILAAPLIVSLMLLIHVLLLYERENLVCYHKLRRKS